MATVVRFTKEDVEALNKYCTTREDINEIMDRLAKEQEKPFIVGLAIQGISRDGFLFGFITCYELFRIAQARIESEQLEAMLKEPSNGTA